MLNKFKRFGVLLLVALLAFPLTAFAQTRDVAEPVEGGEIAIGDQVEGELNADEPAFAYTFTLEEETSINATLVSEDFDCYLTLLGEDGEEIAFDDDGAGNLDSSISTTLDAGTYTLVAQSYGYRNGSAGAVGEFTLSLNTVQINRIEYGQDVEGQLTADQLEVRYTFTGAAGDVIIAEHYSDDYDSYLILEYNGIEQIYNDDGAGNLDSRLGPYVLPSTGEYTLVVTSLSRSDTGSYEVTLDRVDLATIEFNEATTVEFAPNDSSLYFQFEANAGDVIDIEVDSDLDTSLSLVDPSGYSVVNDEDSGSGSNPEALGVSLSSSGTYTLILQSVEGEAGPVEVSVSRAELPSLNDGPQDVTFSSSTFTRTVTFEAEAGTTYRLTLDLTRGTEGSPSIDITQEGISLGYTSTSQVSRLSIDLVPDSDGEVVLRISDYSYSNLTYQVTLEEVGNE